MCATKFLSSNFANENYKWIFKTHQNQVFTSYIWYSITPSKVSKSFYFILNEKYGLFMKFWAPFQPSTTKTRPCSSLQSFRKIHICINFPPDCSDVPEIRIFQESCKEPQGRVFVVQCWKGTRNFRKSPYFSFRIKWNFTPGKNVRFWH